MRLLPFVIAIAAVVAAPARGAEPAAPYHSRPYTVKCVPSVNVWVELDTSGLPAHEYTRAESKKRVLLHLTGSTPSRGEAVVCSYASRGRDVTSSYSVRCANPRQERGQRHSYSCK